MESGKLRLGRDRTPAPKYFHTAARPARGVRRDPPGMSSREVAVIYKVFGPYRIRRDGMLISKTLKHLRAFWSEIEAENRRIA